MAAPISSATLEKFSTFGDLLRFLRRKAGITQLELAIAVGYSDGQISRLEKNLRPPDLPTLEARFLPALYLEDEPKAAARLLELAANVSREDAPSLGICPYKGLNYFDESDAELFVGRETLTASLAERVLALPAQVRFIAIVGASGSGKSSLVRAGLIPALRWDKRTADWQIHTLTPTARPLENLATQLTRAQSSLVDAARLMDDLAREPRSLHLFISREMIPGNDSRFLLVIDQFEELFALCRSEEERNSFIANLLMASSAIDGPTIVVITLRADFYAHCADYPQLREALTREQEYIGAMSSRELRRVIEEPARSGRWEFEPGLVDLLLQDVGHEPGALPLLSHALLETWERRRGRTMTLSGYIASGGVRGAIAETAEAVFTDQFTREQQAIARRIFLRLTELGDETATGDTRRRASFDELIRNADERDTTRAVLKALADARLITMAEDTAEVAHEALIREWPTLRAWLEDNRESLRLHRQITEAAQEWSKLNRDPDLLYRGARLTQMCEWSAVHADEMNELESEYLGASVLVSEQETAEREAQRQRELEAARKLAATEQRRAEAERQRAEEQTRAATQLRKRAVYLASALVIAVLMALAALFFGGQARRSELVAESQRNVATSRELAAAAVSNLNLDPQLSLLLALRAVQSSDTLEAENALHRSILTSRVVFTVHHDASVWSVAYSPDGKRLATSSQDKTAKIWDAATGRLLLTLVGHTDSVNSIAFSPDGRHLATSSDDHTAKVWDANTGKELFTLSGHQDIVWSVTYSRDGKLIATAGTGDRTVRLWEATTGQLRRVLQYADTVNSVAFSPDGTRLATGTGQELDANSEGRVVISDVSTGKELSELSSDIPGGVAAAAFSPDGTRMAGAVYLAGQVIVWDLSTGRELQRFTQSLALLSVAFSPDGKWLAAAGTDQIARIYDLASGRELFSLASHNLGIACVAFGPDGKRLATANSDGTASVWDLTPTRELLHLPLPGQQDTAYLLLAYSPDGSRILANSSVHTARIWDARTGAELPTFRAAPSSTLVNSYDRDGRLIDVGIQDQTAMVVDVQTGSAGLALAESVDASGNWAISPDGTRLVNYRPDSTISIWNLTNGKKLLTFTGNRNGNTNLVDCVQLPGNGECIVFSPDGKRLVTSDADTRAHNQFDTGDTNGNGNTTATVWDSASGQRLLTLASQSGVIWDISYSPDGRRIATGSDGEADIWDALTGRLLLRFPGHTNSVYAIKFSPDGKEVATEGADGSLKLWNAATGETLLTLPIKISVYGDNLAFSPDGKQLAEADATGINVFVLPIKDVVALAETRLTRSLTDSECQQYLHVESCPASP
jgi:WD40 repeat protein/transcriptional regulator with XRE-family HTH domain